MEPYYKQAILWLQLKQVDDSLCDKMKLLIQSFPKSDFEDEDPYRILRKAYTMANAKND